MLRCRRRPLLALPAALAWPMARAQGRGLTVAAAADLRFALDEVMGPFRAAQPGARIEAIYGASGKLATQIRNGAPFDVFLSADREFADALHRDGFAAGPSRLYAVGHLVAWSAEPALGRLALVPLVRDARVRRFAIANPEAAPYGRRAREAMQSQGLWEAVQPKLVFGENIAQTAQYVQTGAAQAGLVALSIVLSPSLAGRGAYTRIPEGWHRPLEQSMVVTARAMDNALAHALVAHLESPAARATFVRYGFALPGESASR